MSNITVDILLSTTTPSMLVNSAEGNTAKLETLITYLQESLHTTEKTLAELKEREEKLKKQVETEHHNKTLNGTKIGGEEKTEESSEALTSPAAESSSEIETLPLQAPWVSGIDEASGQTYYYNSLTKQSQWMNPFSMSDKTPEVSVAPSTVNNILSSGSSEQYDGQQPEPEKTVDTKTTLQAAAISSKDSHQRHQNNRNSYHQHHKQHKRRTLAPIVQQSLEVIAKSFKPRKIAKPISAKVAICCAFKSKPLMFSSFEPDYFMQMVDSMIPLSAHDGECITNQGDTLGEYFYAIEKGTFLIEVDGSVVAELPSPDGSTNCFGELAMLFNSPRNATVRAKGSNCKLWALDRDTFRVMQYRQKKRKVVDACVALQRVKLLHDLSESQIRTIGEVVNIQKFKEGDVIIQKGDTEGREFFMIQDGIVEVRDITGAPADFTVLLQAGDSFGEAALLTSEPRNATIVSASDDVVCMSLSFQVVNNLFGSLETLIAHNYVYYTLNVVPLLKERSDEYIRKLSSLAVKETVVQGDILAHLYELCDRFAVIRKGTCIIEETGEEIGPGSYIGDEMFGAEQPAHFAHTVVATTDVEILEISWDAMQHISLGEVTEDEEKGSRGDAGFKTNWDEIEKQSGLFKKDVANTAEGISGYGIPEVSASMRRFYTSDDLQGRLEIVGVLGEGAFGRVELVKDKRDDTFIALKIQRKQHLVDINAVHKAQQERQLMKTIQHSFICQLYSTFQDRNCIYMALEFFRGGELFSLVDRMGGALSIQDTKFYAAPIVSALEYLHEQNIVYRDVKTENVVIDSYGYPILVDFGFAKKLNNDSGITFTICGTTNFLAPEVILGSGHGTASDCWSFGIMIHELLTGDSPFSRAISSTTATGNDCNDNGRDDNNETVKEKEGSSDDDPMVIIKRILEMEIILSKNLKLDAISQNFILDLLDRNQATRLGCGKQLLMSDHLFFSCEENDNNTESIVNAGDQNKSKSNSDGWWSKVMKRENVYVPWVPLEGDNVDVREYFETERFASGSNVGLNGDEETFVGRNSIFEGF